MAKIKLIVDGGKMTPGPAVAQQLGPMGINLGKVTSDVNEATKGFAGMKVPVELDVDAKTKEYKISVFSPPMSELIKKALGIDKGSGMAQKQKAGNISIEELIGIAKTKMPDLLCKDLKSALKTAVGSCVSLGVLVESKEPTEIEIEIDKGTYDKEISEEITEPTTEKKQELQAHFKELRAEQDKKLKVAQEAKEAEDAKKAEEKSAEGAADKPAEEKK